MEPIIEETFWCRHSTATRDIRQVVTDIIIITAKLDALSKQFMFLKPKATAKHDSTKIQFQVLIQK